MAEGRGIFKRFKSKSKKKKKKKDRLKEFRIAYRSLEDQEEFLKKILLPLVVMGLFVIFLPNILLLVGLPVLFSPFLLPIGGSIPIILGILYPYITWKNKEVDINEKMHFFITHLRVLSISDLSMKDIVEVLGDKKEYGNLAEEIRKIRVLAVQWKTPLERAFRFIAERTPSKILKDFLDRFSQSVSSGVNHRDFIESEQEGVIEEYKTMYESSNDVITVLNEIYVALLTSIVFLMVFGIIAPMVAAADFSTYMYGSSFVFIASELCLLYFVYSFIPKDDIWHKSEKKSAKEKKINKFFIISVIVSATLGAILFIAKYILPVDFIQIIPFEILTAITFTPLIISGVMVLLEEEEISRREKNFMGFIPSLGAIAAMKSGRITASIYYLSQKDYGVLTESIVNLYKRLYTKINDTASWEWFGVETHSNYIQRFSEMFREATHSAANPREVGKMITENMRKIKNLRYKKLTVLKTTNALLYGITLGITLTIYVTLIIGRHMNDITTGIGDPFESIGVSMVILQPIPENVFTNAFTVIFFVLVIHCFIIAMTLKVFRGGHKFITLFHFVPLVWIVAVIAVATDIGLSEFLAM